LSKQPDDDRTAARFLLVRAAHRFLWVATPFRDPDSTLALRDFIEIVSRFKRFRLELEWVLLQILRFLGEFTDRSSPALLERYLASSWQGVDPLEKFQALAQDAFAHCGSRSPQIHRAMSIIEAEYANPNLALSSASIAKRLGRTSEALMAEFFEQLGIYPKEYLRQVRLNRGAWLLISTDSSIKEVWVAVGYNDASSFDRDFRKRFGVTPTEYRIHGRHDPSLEIRSAVRDVPPATSDAPRLHVAARKRRTLLVIDDDQGTRETLERFLRLEGYTVHLAASGAEGMPIATSQTIDMILLDYHLDDTDGIAWLNVARERNVAAHVLLFTADMEIEERRAEIEALKAVPVLKLLTLDDIADTIELQFTDRHG
jgi:AraC-like DNA-binding protein/CheY-like chemotaxis protein